MIAQKYDIITLFFLIIIIAFGVVAIYSATVSVRDNEQNYFIRQIIWAIIGIGIMVSVSLAPLKIINQLSYGFYGFSLFLLLLVLFIGKTGQSAERWLTFGAVNIQPSELAKLATVLAVSKYLSRKEVDVNKFKYFSITLGLILLPFFFIVRQPDLGTGLVFLALIIPIVYWAGLNWFNIFIIITPFFAMILSFNFWSFLFLMIIVSIILIISQKKHWILAAVFLLNIAVGIATPTIWNQLRPYQQKRILTFINPEKDSKGAGYQIIQSQVAIGSGGSLGKGYLKGSQTHLRFLPEQHTDFIFSVIGEEFGFLGITCVLLVFLVLILRLIHLASIIKNQFSSLAVIGIITIITFHTIVNIGMTIGMAPVTGLPLPFLSYGGSSLLTNTLMMGIVLNISRNKFVR